MSFHQVKNSSFCTFGFCTHKDQVVVEFYESVTCEFELFEFEYFDMLHSVTHVAESFCYEHWEYDELGLRDSDRKQQDRLSLRKIHLDPTI